MMITAHQTAAMQEPAPVFDVRLGAGYLPDIDFCDACIARVVEILPGEAHVDCPDCGAPVTTIRRKAAPEPWEDGLEPHQKLSVMKLGCYPQHLEHSQSECPEGGVVRFAFPGQPDPVCPECGQLMASFRVVDPERYRRHIEEAKARREAEASGAGR